MSLDGSTASARQAGMADLQCRDGQVARAMEWTLRALEIYPDDMSALVNGACRIHFAVRLPQREP